jgi:hypothetical protein
MTACHILLYTCKNTILIGIEKKNVFQKHTETKVAAVQLNELL